MDIDQLKLILETVNAAGEGAFIIALLWILKGYFVGILATGTIIFAVWNIATRIFDFTTTYQALNELRRLAGHSPYGKFTDSERSDMTKIFMRGLNSNDQ